MGSFEVGDLAKGELGLVKRMRFGYQEVVQWAMMAKPVRHLAVLCWVLYVGRLGSLEVGHCLSVRFGSMEVGHSGKGKYEHVNYSKLEYQEVGHWLLTSKNARQPAVSMRIL